MIESEERRKQITDDISRWCDLVKATPLLRAYDISSLVDTILHEFYKVTFCCGHLGHWDDGVHIAFKDFENGEECETSGIYCKDCAEKLKQEIGAWEVDNIIECNVRA